MNHAGEIRTLVGIAEPEVRVWTNVGDAHLGFFASAEAIADAKAEILEAADRSHVLVANANDPRVLERAARFPGRVVTFGIDTDADVRASQVQLRGLEGMAAEVTHARGHGASADAAPRPRQPVERAGGASPSACTSGCRSTR